MHGLHVWNPTCYDTHKVHIFWEGHTFLQNLHRIFVLCSNGEIYGGDFAKFSGLFRIYELYDIIWNFQKLWPCCAGPTRLLFLGRNMNIICRYTCSNSNMTDHFGSYFYVINYIFTSVDRQIMFCEVTFNLTQISDAFLHFSGWNILCIQKIEIDLNPHRYFLLQKKNKLWLNAR